MTASVLSRGATAVLHRMLRGPIEDNSMLSPAGVWLLLATAASGAVGVARTELTALTGDLTPHDLDAAVRALDGTGASAALGAWTGPGFQVRSDWSRQLNRLSSGPIPDRPTLDRWAAEATGGLIDSFPLQPDPRAILVLASALGARSRWAETFTDRGGRLYRNSRRTDCPVLLSPSGRTVAAVVRTEDPALEVLLAVGGPDASARDVLTDMAGELTEVAAGQETDLPSWVGRAASAFPTTSIELDSFDLTHRLDLLVDPDRYGLRPLTDPFESENLLAGLLAGDVPVLATQAVSVSRMQFDASGFAAGSVSAMSMRAGSMPPSRTDHVTIRFELRHRPFGILVRTTTDRAPLFVGWIAPDPEKSTARRSR